MVRSFLRFTGIALSTGFVAAASGSWLGCGGTEASDLFGPSNSDAGTSEPPSSDGGAGGGEGDDAGETPPNDDGGSTDPGNQDSGTVDADGGNSNLNSTPHEVPCGEESCSAPKDLCCYSGNKPKVCKQGPTPSDCDQPVACDEAADCENHRICCLTRDTGENLLKTTCEAGKCPSKETGTGPSSFQICTMDTECPSGKSCKPYNCAFAGVLPYPPFNACENPSPAWCHEAK